MTDTILTFTTEHSDLETSLFNVRAVTGRAAMSTLYEFELLLDVDRVGGLVPEEIDGLLANTCFFSVTGTSTVEVHGVLRRLELLGAAEARPVSYRVHLVPRLWNTTRRFRTRVYQDANVQQIVDATLSESGLEAEWILSRDYPASEYTVQYQETDFAFVSRQLEHWGLYYYFRQDPDGEVLVIADNNRQFQSLDGYDELPFNARMGRSGVTGSVHSIRTVYEPQPAKVALREYNWRTPSVPLLETHLVDERSGQGFHWRYGEHFKDGDEGAMLAKIRAEQLLNQRELYRGTCSVPGLAPGHTFTLMDCPLPELNVGFLVTSVEPTYQPQADSGDEAAEYPFTAVVFERDDPPVVEYRSQLLTAKPKIEGVMHGVIDGAVTGKAAPIDDLGRYRVNLPMDTLTEPGGRASRWIRMAQPYSGRGYGMHMPLHIGTEVAIAHIDGDPDRPIILGSVPNTETVSPVVDAEATKNRIRTRSGILVEFEDDA